MKRTITLTSEDLDFMDNTTDNQDSTVLFYLREILKGDKVHPPHDISEYVNALEALTKPVKMPKIDPNGTYHENPNMNAAIQEFIKHRSSIKKPMTQMGMDRLLRDFKGFTVKECISAIDTAIKGRYQGVFPKKEFSSKESPQTAETQKGIDYSEGL